MPDITEVPPEQRLTSIDVVRTAVRDNLQLPVSAGRVAEAASDEDIASALEEAFAEVEDRYFALQDELRDAAINLLAGGAGQ